MACGAAAIALAAVACAPNLPARPDIIVLVIDTLRADRLARHGGKANLTPFLDELAERSNFFARAYATAPWTSPSVASLFTSRYQSQHGIRVLNSVLSPEELTLAEILRSSGYATAAFSANGMLSKLFGYGQGFDVHKAKLNMDVNTQLALTKRASELVESAFAWVDRLGDAQAKRPPVFLYLQFMETHAPYAPPAEFLERVRRGKPPIDLDVVNRTAVANLPMSEQMARDVEDVYDAAVLEIDAEFRKLFTRLDERGMLDDSLVVVTADHGDEFRDHGKMSHSHTLFNELLHVPLLVLTPGQSSGGVVNRVVSLVDVAPTILELAGIAKPASFEGSSFVLDLEPRGMRESLGRWIGRFVDDRPEPAAYSERASALSMEEPPSAHARSLVGGAGKIIESLDGTRSYFDLASDPREQRPDGLPESARSELAARLEAMRAHVGGTAVEGERHELDESQKEALRALGYAH